MKENCSFEGKVNFFANDSMFSLGKPVTAENWRKLLSTHQLLLNLDFIEEEFQ